MYYLYEYRSGGKMTAGILFLSFGLFLVGLGIGGAAGTARTAKKTCPQDTVYIEKPQTESVPREP